MKRLLPAAALAVLFHATLFGMDINLLFDKKHSLREYDIVTVTMSYRRSKPIYQPEKEPAIDQKILEEKIIGKDERFTRDTVEEVEKTYETHEQSQTELRDEITEHADSKKESLAKKTAEKTGIVEEENIQNNIISNIGVVYEATPLYKKNPLPNYPRTARKRGYQGTVVLSVLVDEMGLVKNLWVFESSGYRLLDNAAIETVSEWLFEPGRKGDQKVEMWVQVPVQFKLE